MIKTHNLLFLSDIYLDKRIQYRFPKSHKKRICKKWKKLNRNFKYIPDTNIYVIEEGILVGHPTIIKNIKKKINYYE